MKVFTPTFLSILKFSKMIRTAHCNNDFSTDMNILRRLSFAGELIIMNESKT